MAGVGAPPAGDGRADETLLVARIAAGDDTALAAVYDRFSSYVFGLALRVTGDRTAAEDVTQDVFVRLWSTPAGFDGERGSLRSYLGVMTHRRAVDRVRRDTAARRRDEADAARSASDGSGSEVADAATGRVLAQRVRDAVDLLPPDQRVAVQLAYFGGHSFREVASLLGVPEGTAKSRLRLALRKLAGTLGDESIEAWT